jgi:hypothetical protein
MDRTPPRRRTFRSIAGPPGLAGGLGVLGLALALAWAPAARAAVRVALTPATLTATPGTEFDVFVEVTEAGSEFNGFEFVAEFDPAALTFVPLAPTSLQQGCLMTGGCSVACGNTFHVFNAAADSVSASVVLLCNQVSLTGPGQIYKLRFLASSTPQITQVTFRRRRFYNAGLFVNPVLSSDCTIGIGINLGVDGPGRSLDGRVRVEPNPSRSGVAFVTDGGGTDIRGVEIVDLQGRLVRRLVPASGGAPLAWDGTDIRGRRVAAGVYLARIARGSRVEHSRVVLLP